jgi:hypothetical protein
MANFELTLTNGEVIKGSREFTVIDHNLKLKALNMKERK